MSIKELRDTKGLKRMLHSTKGAMVTVPDAYILPPSLRPVTNNMAKSPQIPVIDLAGLHTSNHSEVVQAIGDACEHWGFFQAVNHGIPRPVLEGMMQALQQFFDLPFEEKFYYGNDPSRIMRFGTNIKQESILEWRNHLRHPLVPNLVEFLPHKPTCYKNAALQYADHLKKFSSSLLAAISENLKLESCYISELFEETVLFANHYPPCPNPELTIGAKAHTDSGGITILLQNHVPGLEVNHNGKWIPIKPMPNVLTILVGDQLEILTNGKYKSIEHRALSTTESRISIANFVQPSLDSKVTPLIHHSHPPKYEAVVFREYLMDYVSRDLQQKQRLHPYAA